MHATTATTAPRGRCSWAVRLGFLLGAATGVVVAVLVATSSPASAGGSAPGTFEITQPDGQELTVRQWGDEWHHGFETRAGHTIVQRADGYWVYARQRPDGTLAPTQRVVGDDAPGSVKHLRDEAKSQRALGQRAAALPSAVTTEGRGDRSPSGLARRGEVEVDLSAAAPAVGDAPTLVILAQFTDRASMGTTPAQWHGRFFGPGKSVRDYFDKASRGQLTVVPANESSGTQNDGIVGWVTLDMANPGNVGDKSRNKEATKRAILAADPFVNYAAYDTDGDGVVRNSELHVTVVAAGFEASYKAQDPKHNVWAHAATLFYDDIPRVDGTYVGGWGYTQFGEIHGNPKDPSHVDHQATIGIIVHELGHDLGLPDLYDYDYDSEAVGDFSVMAAGEWTQTPTDPFLGQTPVLPDGWSRATLGWVAPTRVTGTAVRTLNAAAGPAAANHAVVLGQNPYGYDWDWDVPAGGEYFLVENRQRIPGTYDEMVPGDGLLVLHVEEASDDNTTTGARIVDVEEADGLNQLDGLTNEGDPGDLFPGSQNRRSFGGATTPNSAYNDGTPSGAAMTGISDSGPAMTATFTGPADTAPRNDAFANAVTVQPGSWGHKTNNSLATIQAPAGETTQGNCDLGKTAWYRFTPPRDMVIESFTSGSSFDTVLNFWEGDSLGSLTPRGCNDEWEENGGYSYLTPRVVEAGRTYYLQVGGWAPETGPVAGGDLWLSVETYPLNEYFANAEAINGSSGDVAGNSLYSSLETGEPKHAGQRYTGSVWYRWTAPSTGQFVFDTLGSTQPDTVLAVYTGSSAAALSEVASNNNVSSTNLRSRVRFAATAGTTYRIAVGHQPWDATSGDFVLHWAFAPAAPTEAPRITGTPRYGSLLRADVGTWPGVTGFSYVWRRDGSPIAGAVGATYRPVRADVGRRVAVTVTGTGPGLSPGSATSPARTVGKAVPAFSETAQNARKRAAGVVQGKSVVLTFKLGPWADGGKVTAVLAGKPRGTATVASGQVVIRVSAAQIAPGQRMPLVLRFKGTAITSPASKAYTLRVRPAR